MDTWKFNQEVTDIFEDMLQRSIPQLDVMRNTVTDIVQEYAQTDTWVVDLGCSRGDALVPIIERLGSSHMYAGIEVSEPMYKAAKKRLQNKAIIDQRDLRYGIPHYDSSVVLSVFTLQFIPINYRQELLKQVYDSLRPGGILILVEKILGATSNINNLMVKQYHSLKHANGYSYEEIDRKALMLEGVLVPVTAKWNEELLRQAGFESDCFWRWMNFAGWVAYKK